MDKFTAFLKKKGPGGIPMGILAVGAAIILYFGYRHFAGKGSSSSSSDTTSTDTGQGTADGATTGGASGDLPTPDSPVDNSQPPTSTAPPQKISDPDVDVKKLTQEIDKSGHKKKPKKHHPGSNHDHKQGAHHTAHKPVHNRHAKNHHAPPTQKRPHSKDKAQTVRNVSAGGGGGRPPLKEMRHETPQKTALPISSAKRAPVKHHPAPPPRQEMKHGKQPLRKRRRG
jgi:hypothetical protein